MKTLLLGILMISFQAHADFTCDIRVNVTESEVSAGTLVSGTGQGISQKQYNGALTARELAIGNCVKKGGRDCKIVPDSVICEYEPMVRRFSLFDSVAYAGDVYNCTALAEGMKPGKVRQLSAKELSKQRKELTCEKLRNCRNDALNAHDVSPIMFDKLDRLEKYNDCV